MSKWNANFQTKRSNIKVTGRQKPHNWCHIYLRVVDQAQAGQAPTVNEACGIVRPNLLSAPECEMFDYWMDGLISYQH